MNYTWETLFDDMMTLSMLIFAIPIVIIALAFFLLALPIYGIFCLFKGKSKDNKVIIEELKNEEN